MDALTEDLVCNPDPKKIICRSLKHNSDNIHTHRKQYKIKTLSEIKYIRELIKQDRYGDIILTPIIVNAQYFIDEATYKRYDGKLTTSPTGINRVTLLHEALINEDNRLVDLILACNFDIEFKLDSHSRTFFSYAISNIPVLTNLVTRFKHMINISYRSHGVPFHNICESGNLDAIRLFIANGADISYNSISNTLMPLDYIQYSNDYNKKDPKIIDTIKILIEEHNMKFSNNLIYSAIRHRWIDLIKCLFNYHIKTLDDLPNYDIPRYYYGYFEQHRPYNKLHLLCIMGSEPLITEYIDQCMISNTLRDELHKQDWHSKTPFDYLDDTVHANIASKYIKKPFLRQYVYAFMMRLLMRPHTLYIKRLVNSFD